jgi:hypothetical protein
MIDPAKAAIQNIESKRLQQRKLQLAVNRMSMEVRIAELEEEKRRLLENFPLYDAEEAEIDSKILELTSPQPEPSATKE